MLPRSAEVDPRLSDSAAGHDAIIENAGNAWFQPVPTAGCREDLLEAIDLRMSQAEEDDDNDDELPEFPSPPTLIQWYEGWLNRVETGAPITGGLR